jgi:hypothetical protein
VGLVGLPHRRNFKDLRPQTFPTSRSNRKGLFPHFTNTPASCARPRPRADGAAREPCDLKREGPGAVGAAPRPDMFGLEHRNIGPYHLSISRQSPTSASRPMMAFCRPLPRIFWGAGQIETGSATSEVTSSFANETHHKRAQMGLPS